MTKHIEPHTIELTDSENERYARQLRLDGIGLEGQRKLKAASVFISRSGGVGGTAAMNLARAGIGRLILAHGGVFTSEYLNRWPLGMTEDVGKRCIDVLTARLRDVNPAVEVVGVAENVSDDNVSHLVAQADVIVDGAPLFEERYTMNREAVRQGKPLVMGAMYSTEGYITTIIPGETPCLSCIYPEKPPYWTNIQVFPAIAPGPIMVGSMVAMEVIKLVTGFGQPLKNTLCFFDLESSNFRHFQITRRPDCQVCGLPH